MLDQTHKISLDGHPTPDLKSGVVQVWVAELVGTSEMRAHAWEILTPAEKERADRLRTVHLQTIFIYSHAWLRVILSHYTKIGPLDLQIAEMASGKPVLLHEGKNPLHFNMSHSGDLAAYAFCSECEVGVDVEEMRPLDDRDAIAARFFTQPEAEWIQARPTEQQEAAFFQIWTRKEAYVKALGHGVSHGLGRFSVLSDSDSVQITEDGTVHPTTVLDLQVPRGYVGAVACEGVDWMLDVHQL